MPVRDEIRAAGIDPSDVRAVITYIGALPIPRDRREGWLRLYMVELGRVPTIAEIEEVRRRPSP